MMAYNPMVGISYMGVQAADIGTFPRQAAYPLTGRSIRTIYFSEIDGKHIYTHTANVGQTANDFWSSRKRVRECGGWAF